MNYTTKQKEKNSNTIDVISVKAQLFQNTNLEVERGHDGRMVVGNLPLTTFVGVNVRVSGLDLVTLGKKEKFESEKFCSSYYCNRADKK